MTPEDKVINKFIIFNPVGEEWEQMSVAFETLDQAMLFCNNQDKKKYPYLRMFAEISLNSKLLPDSSIENWAFEKYHEIEDARAYEPLITGAKWARDLILNNPK